jgi:hypothetical protein
MKAFYKSINSCIFTSLLYTFNNLLLLILFAFVADVQGVSEGKAMVQENVP